MWEKVLVEEQPQGAHLGETSLFNTVNTTQATQFQILI